MRLFLYWAVIYITLPLTVARPIVGLFVYTFVNLFRPEMLFWGKQHMGGRSLFMLFLAILLGMVVNAKLDFRALSQWSLLLTLGIWAVVVFTIFAGSYQDPGLLQWTYSTEILKIFLLCYVMIVVLHTPKLLFRYIELNIVATALLALWGVDQYFRGNERLEGLGGEAIGDSNYAAAYFVLFLPLILSKALDRKVFRKKLFYLGCTGFTFIVILCTQSRGGLVGGIIALGLFFLTTKHRRSLAIYGSIMLVIASPILAEGVLDRLQETAQVEEVEELDASAQSRLVMWRAAWYCFQDNPIFGVGYKCFPRYKRRCVDRVVADFAGTVEPEKVEWMMMHPKVTHSLFYQILSEGGLLLLLPVLLLYLGSLYSNWKCARRHRHRTDELGQELVARLNGVNAGLAGWLVCMIFLDGLVGFFSYIVVTLGTIIRLQLNDSAAVLAELNEGSETEGAGPTERRRRLAVASLAQGREPGGLPAR